MAHDKDSLNKLLSHFRIENEFIELIEIMSNFNHGRFTSSKISREFLKLGIITAFKKGYLNVNFKYLEYGYDSVEREVNDFNNLQLIRDVVEINKLKGGENGRKKQD